MVRHTMHRHMGLGFTMTLWPIKAHYVTDNRPVRPLMWHYQLWFDGSLIFDQPDTNIEWAERHAVQTVHNWRKSNGTLAQFKSLWAPPYSATYTQGATNQ